MVAPVDVRLPVVRVLLEEVNEQRLRLDDLVEDRQRQRRIRGEAARRRHPFERAVAPPFPLLLRPRQHLRGCRIRIDVRQPHAGEIRMPVRRARRRSLQVLVLVVDLQERLIVAEDAEVVRHQPDVERQRLARFDDDVRLRVARGAQPHLRNGDLVGAWRQIRDPELAVPVRDDRGEFLRRVLRLNCHARGWIALVGGDATHDRAATCLRKEQSGRQEDGESGCWPFHGRNPTPHGAESGTSDKTSRAPRSEQGDRVPACAFRRSSPACGCQQRPRGRSRRTCPR